MKKQISSSIRAHLLRNALILLSLLTFNQEIFCQAPPTPTPTPSPTASVCPRPTPGTCVSYEAESDDNILTGSAFILDCPTCSGGQKVGYVGNNSGTLEFDAVGIVVPGRHSMTICYLNGDPVRYALLSVNGNQGIPLTFPSTGSFQTLGSIQTDVVLNTGCNTLEFYNPKVDSWAPDFDRIQFNCPTCALPPTPLTCTPIVVTGSIAQSDPTQTGRAVQHGVPQTCPPTTACQIFDATPRHYDAFTFTNTTGSTQCVTIDTITPCTGNNLIFTAAYLGTFNSANICTNWIGDSGSSPNPERAFHVQVPAGQTLIVVVSEVLANAGCSSYTVTITATCQTAAAFFTGEVPLGNGVYYLQFPNGTPFGYYSYLPDRRFIYHFDLGFEYWFDANDGHNGIFFYDFASTHFFYTSPSFPFPYLYDFSLNSVLYYFPDSQRSGHYTTNPRYFYNFATSQIITM